MRFSHLIDTSSADTIALRWPFSHFPSHLDSRCIELITTDYLIESDPTLHLNMSIIGFIFNCCYIFLVVILILTYLVVESIIVD